MVRPDVGKRGVGGVLRAAVARSVPVRDSKVTSGPVLVFGTGTWAAFVAGVREGGIEVIG
ncbi:DUF397 domain-containing protein [Streptomyces sp. NPDC087218]|uniref:DUF397 domain-containing protein n=1 Tax=Streptomyces sp. NPDC087218 TaxID=3365769 RepID=UPI0038241F02